MNVLFLETPAQDGVTLGKLLPQTDCMFSPDPLHETKVPNPDWVQVLSPMVHSKIGDKEMERFPNLKLIATRSTGFDHIDLDAAKARHVLVANVPRYGARTVAEYNFALLLSLTRKIHQAFLRSLEGQTEYGDLVGTDLADKVLGVVGTGHIGQNVARIGNGFGMKVIAFDPLPNEEIAKQERFSYVPLDELLRTSHVVSLNCPLTEKTHHLLDRAAFEKMQGGVYVVNTARGAIVDSAALLWALDEGIVAGAGLDVLEDEAGGGPLYSGLHEGGARREIVAENVALMRHPNVIVTPHMAYYSQEALLRILETTAENIRAFAREEPINLVT